MKINVSFLFERKFDKVVTLNIVHFPNFEISASLLLAPHLTVSKFNRGNTAVTGNIDLLLY